MSDYVDVETAIAENDLEEARALLRTYLELDADIAHVWYLAALAAVNDKQRQYFLEKAVELDPLHARAGNALHDLLHTPQQKPDSVVTQSPELAPLELRAVAFLIDTGIMLALAILTLIVFSLLIGIFSGGAVTSTWVLLTRNLWVLLMMTIYGSYYGYALSRKQGQTPGKRWMGVRVIREDGKPLTLGNALLRSWIGYSLALSPLGLGFFWAFFDKKQRAWQDIIAGTIVVRA